MATCSTITTPRTWKPWSNSRARAWKYAACRTTCWPNSRKWPLKWSTPPLLPIRRRPRCGSSRRRICSVCTTMPKATRRTSTTSAADFWPIKTPASRRRLRICRPVFSARNKAPAMARRMDCSACSAARRYRAGAAAAVDGDEDEHCLGDLAPFAGQRVVAPHLDQHLDRAAADLECLGVKGQLRTNGNRHEKGHAIDRHRCHAAAGDLAGHGSTGQIHLRYQPATIDVAETIGFAW